MTDPRSAIERRLVWDLPTRLFHWLFATSIFLSWLTTKLGISWMKWHLRLGFVAIVLLIFRIIWGFIGPRHARFANFVRGPAAIATYLRRHRNAPQTPGHNPLGALMVLFMLALGIVQTATGLFASDDIAWAGPYNPAVAGAVAQVFTTVHQINFYLLLGAIALHLAAIAYYGLAKGHNLIGPMLRGWKDARTVSAEQAISGSEWLKAAVLALVSIALVVGLVWAAPPPPDANLY